MLRAQNIGERSPKQIVTATHRIQGCGASSSCPDSELPSDVSSRPQPACRVLGAVKAGLEAPERAARPERRPTLTAPARAGLQHVWVGAKKRDSRSNKETDQESKKGRKIAALKPLDNKSPIQGQALRVAAKTRPALTGPARDGCEIWRSGWKNARGAGRTKEWTPTFRTTDVRRTGRVANGRRHVLA
jgi:hypothetical protein